MGKQLNTIEGREYLEQPDITVSIVNHNSHGTLHDSLQSVQRGIHGLTAEIVVVDNLCEYRVTPFLQDKFPQVKVLENLDRLGFGANHNQTIRIARGKYVLVLNPDVFLPANALSEMLHFMERSPETAVCGPQLVNESGIHYSQSTRPLKPIRETILLACYISNLDPQKLKKLTNWRRRVETPPPATISSTVSHSQSSPQSVPWISGACMFFRRDALEEIGGFDEQFFLYFEETDWCLRATKNGKKIHFLPWITAVHIGGTSTRPNYLDHLMIYVQSAVRFYRKHSGPHIAKLMKIAVRTVAAFNLMRWTLSVKMKPENHQSQNDWVEISRKTAIGRW